MSSTLEILKNDVVAKFGSNNFQFLQTPVGDDVITCDKETVPALLKYLKEYAGFNFLMDVCGVDYHARELRFNVVYHLFNSTQSTRLRVKTQLADGEAVQTATTIWKGADWFEREAYDMFGIKFTGHLNLRKILTHHQFVGHPLRKDYEADHQQHCDSVMPIFFDNTPDQRGDQLDSRFVPLNVGPSHPAMHGTLRVMAELDGETIVRANCEIGYLHRCFEKMAETHPYNQVIPYTDRLNYCSSPINNFGWYMTVEKLLKAEIPKRAQYMRVVLMELARISDHLICNSVIGVDISTESIHYAQKQYHNYDNLEFIMGSCDSIPLTGESVDVVVSFETIEHHDRHDEMICEIKRAVSRFGIKGVAV